MPRFSYGRRMLQHDGGPNRYFLMYLFSEQSIAIEFLRDVGLLQNKMQCNTCGRDMAWSADSNLPKGFRWRCQMRIAGVRCNQSESIKGRGYSRVISLRYEVRPHSILIIYKLEF